MRRRRRLAPGFLLLAVGYVFCVFWAFTRSTPVIPARKTTIRIAHWQIEKGPPDGIAAAIRRYEELNPDVKVEQMLVPGAVYRQWLRTTLSGGTAPDILEYGAWLENLSDLPLRYFEPLTDALLEPNPYNRGTPLEGQPWLKTFEDELIEARTNSPEPGQYFSVTLSRGSMRLFGNLALLREITGGDRVPENLDDFMRLCERVKAYGARQGRLVVPLAGARDNTIFTSFIYLHGMLTGMSFTLDRDGLLAVDNRQLQAAYLEKRWQFGRPEVRGALTVLADICAQMRPGYLQLGRDDAVQQFMRGEALFIFTGTFDGTSLRRLAPFPVGAFRLPQPTKDDPRIGRYLPGRFVDGDNTTGFSLFLNKAGPNKAQAVDFLRFLTSYESGKLFTAHSGWISATREVPIPPDLTNDISPRDGYVAGPCYCIIGGEATRLFWREFHRMTGPRGSVDNFTAALDELMPEAMLADLRTEQRNQQLTLPPRDVRIAAAGELSRRAPDDTAARLRRERLESAQNQSEGLALQLEAQLRALAPAR